MVKVVVNKCHGGFGLSLKGIEMYARLKGLDVYFYKQTAYGFSDGKDEYTRLTKSEINKKSNALTFFYSLKKDLGKKVNKIPDGDDIWLSDREIPRDDLDLVSVVTELGEDADGSCANLSIVEVPDDVDWQIDEYDGSEWIAEKHRTW